MKHYFPIPFLDAADTDWPDIGGFVRRHRWEMRSFELIGLGIMRYGGETQYLRATIAPRPHSPATAETRMVVASGSTLIYDDETGCMGVSFQPEPEDAAPAPAQEPEDAVPLSFVDRHADMSLIRSSRRRRPILRSGEAVPPGEVARLFEAANGRPEHMGSVAPGLFGRLRGAR